MSVLTDLIYGGSNAVAGLTEGAVNDAIAKYGADKELAFPDTAYYFPTIYAATGVKVKTLGDLPACVAQCGARARFYGDLDEGMLHGYVEGQKLGGYYTDCNTITDALPPRPLLAIGSHQGSDGYHDAWFVVENMHYVRDEVCNSYNASFRCWDENGRLFAEAYDRQAREDGDMTVGNLFEIRQLNKRGAKILDRCVKSGEDVPIERLFSPRYSDPPRVAELAFGCPHEQWEHPEETPSASAKSARRVARNLSGTFQGGRAKVGKAV